MVSSLRDCGLGVHFADGPAERGHGRRRLADGTDQQGAGLGVLRQWDIDPAGRFAVGTVVLYSPTMPTMRSQVSLPPNADAAADGIGVAPPFGARASG